MCHIIVRHVAYYSETCGSTRNYEMTKSVEFMQQKFTSTSTKLPGKTARTQTILIPGRHESTIIICIQCWEGIQQMTLNNDAYENL